jgi:hypothetical protein
VVVRNISDYFDIHHYLSVFFIRDRVFTARYGLDIYV